MSFDHSAQAEKRIHWQYRNGAQLRQWIDTLPSIAQGDIESVALSIQNVLDLDNANTWQLDVIGRIVGQSRDSQEALDDDDVYRTVIRSRIAKNSSYATIDGIKTAIEYVTQDEVLEVVDGFDMTFSIVFDSPLDPLVKDLILTVDILPRPQGVRFTGFIEPELLPKFGVTGINESPANDVEGVGELQTSVVEDEEGFIMDLGDGVMTGNTTPTVGNYGGHIAELYEVT